MKLWIFLLVLAVLLMSLAIVITNRNFGLFQKKEGNSLFYILIIGKLVFPIGLFAKDCISMNKTELWRSSILN